MADHPDQAAIRKLHRLAGRDQQVADLLDRIAYGVDLAAVAHQYRDLHGFLHPLYGVFRDIQAVAAFAREMRDGEGGR